MNRPHENRKCKVSNYEIIIRAFLQSKHDKIIDFLLIAAHP